jgi:CHAD domain
MSKAWPVQGIDPDCSLDSNARRILRVRVGELYSFEPIIDDPAISPQLHDLRISAKRLRYTLELFDNVFGEIGERNIDRVKTVQGQLGDLHDIDVRIVLIQDELVTLAGEQVERLAKSLSEAPPALHGSITTAALRPPPDDPRRGLVALLGRQYTDRRKVYERFRRTWDRFSTEGMREELVILSRSPDYSIGS